MYCIILRVFLLPQSSGCCSIMVVVALQISIGVAGIVFLCRGIVLLAVLQQLCYDDGIVWLECCGGRALLQKICFW